MRLSFFECVDVCYGIVIFNLGVLRNRVKTMNKTDRLLAIVLELQSQGRLRAEDLAATFEVSKRTIYRDIQALSEAGVPVVAVTGQGYSLMEGYFLPPLNFSSDEALMLILGSDFMAQNFDTPYGAAALSACRKIELVLPDALTNEVNYLRENIRFLRHSLRGRPGQARAVAPIARSPCGA